MNVNIFCILKNIGINELKLENKMLFLSFFAKWKIQKTVKKKKFLDVLQKTGREFYIQPLH